MLRPRSWHADDKQKGTIVDSFFAREYTQGDTIIRQVLARERDSRKFVGRDPRAFERFCRGQSRQRR